MEPLSAFVQMEEVSYGKSGGFKLKADPKKVELNNELVIDLKHIENNTADTSPKDRYIIQKKYQNQWRDLFWVEGPVAWTAEAIGHMPNSGGFTWNFKVTKEGLSKDYTVRSAIQPGEYRFVFWGMIDEKPIGTRFEIV